MRLVGWQASGRAGGWAASRVAGRRPGQHFECARSRSAALICAQARTCDPFPLPSPAFNLPLYRQRGAAALLARPACQLLSPAR